jgi:hypothetical protein
MSTAFLYTSNKQVELKRKTQYYLYISPEKMKYLTTDLIQHKTHMNKVKGDRHFSQVWWLMPIILATQEVETGRSKPKASPRRKCEILPDK